MGYLIDGDDSVMHEGMVCELPWPGSSLKLYGKIRRRIEDFINVVAGKNIWVLTLRVADGDRTECWWELSYG
jgi:hypothetical protein